MEDLIDYLEDVTDLSASFVKTNFIEPFADKIPDFVTYARYEYTLDFHCGYCDDKFSYRDDLDEHMYDEHDDVYDRRYNAICNLKIDTKKYNTEAFARHPNVMPPLSNDMFDKDLHPVFWGRKDLIEDFSFSEDRESELERDFRVHSIFSKDLAKPCKLICKKRGEEMQLKKILIGDKIYDCHLSYFCIDNIYILSNKDIVGALMNRSETISNEIVSVRILDEPAI